MDLRMFHGQWGGKREDEKGYPKEKNMEEPGYSPPHADITRSHGFCRSEIRENVEHPVLLSQDTDHCTTGSV